MTSNPPENIVPKESGGPASQGSDTALPPSLGQHVARPSKSSATDSLLPRMPPPDQQSDSSAQVRMSRRMQSKIGMAIAEGSLERGSDAQTCPDDPRQAQREARARDAEIREQKHLARLRSATKVSSSPISSQSAAPMPIPTLPYRRQRPAYGTILSFILVVLLPLSIVAVYYAFYASSQYTSEFKFVVRDAKSAASGSSSGAIQGMFYSSSTSSPLENYIVADYVTSREAVDALQEKLNVKSLYSYPSVDWISRFDDADPIEKFMRYWKRMVTANYDQVTGIGTAQVRAFTPEDAYKISTSLLALSEELINNITNKPQQDAIRYAESDLQRAENRLKLIRKQITEFRNTEQVIDPQASVVTSNVLLAQTLRANVSQLQTELTSLKRQHLSPSAPNIQSLESRIRATKDQLAIVEAQVGGQQGGGKALSSVVAEFEQLEVERQFAQAMTQSLMQNLEQARATAIQQHVYVTAFVSPALAQSSTYPRRLISIGSAAFIFFLAWLIGLLVIRSIREHLT